jgi:hypothetical protein
MSPYVTINYMNDKEKNIWESVHETPNNTLELALNTARENFKHSPEVLAHLENTLALLKNTMSWVKFPEELLLQELQVSNSVHRLMGIQAATIAANDDNFQMSQAA